MSAAKRLVVAVTGASGAQLGLHVLRALRGCGVETHLVLSGGAKRVISAETELCESDFTAAASYCYDEYDLGARISSGSFATDGMIVAPCSMKTLSGIVNAYDDNLIVRAADVCLKEKRRVVLVPRETPLSCAHLRNMLTAARDGCPIVPPELCFYAGADTLEKQLEQLTGRILMQLGLEYGGMKSWRGEI